MRKPHFGQTSWAADCNSAGLNWCAQTGFGQGIVFAIACIIRYDCENARGRLMPARKVSVHLTPALVEPDAFQGGVAVVIDVLRATTTIVHALAAGCTSIRPCA